ncbi:hypothetical protein OL239_17675 [Arthrobacter sp. ATA002]|uniref:hypothetical protein n=1 Tax=Arthrobacter sp. ATA002 TaxID=2991715 RepID=UPI0022A7002D|nr:hypothetical protein [Arthrobacter sp. ATA002]WAP51580.1 hypothetical protein OL239_17675 [Arthrobacter sp. ATA002]
MPLAEALGQVLAEDATALQPVPHYASSAMDGWAVAGPAPWQLVSQQEPQTERWQIHKESGRLPLQPGQAVAILTGGVIPAGADSVLRSESGELSEGRARCFPPVVLPAVTNPGPGSTFAPRGKKPRPGK